MARVERYGPGEEATDFTPGDVVLTHRHNPIARLIRAGQRWRFRGADAVYAYWSHCALVVGSDGALVEAESMEFAAARSPGTGRTNITSLVSDPSSARKAAVARSTTRTPRWGRRSATSRCLDPAIFLLTGWPIRLMRRDHQICSELVVHALQAGGLLTELDPALTLPADLAKRYDVRPRD